MMRTGRCQCGKIRYSSRGETVGLYICHCRECQKQSASAFGISLDVLRAGFAITQGEPVYWTRSIDRGRHLRCAFCANCGSRLWHEADSSSETLSLKGGSLDEPLNILNAIHVWTIHKLPGILIPPNCPQFLEED